MAEENGLDVVQQLAANPVATATIGAQEGAGVQTLTTAEEDSLSRRSEVKFFFFCKF